ncbi:MAG: YhcH/YjgK/YiaL family protein [Candidatus Omnitrophica bacterium]|nr:YhcH/YjgK/YiaL family protein [Candidatus Omnitrophota bacterium]
MIFDQIQNLKYYNKIIPQVLSIQEFIARTDCLSLPAGEIEICGRDLFVRTNEYMTEPQGAKRFETHQLYADVQYVVYGTEMMGFCVEKHLNELTLYEPPNDIQFFKTPAQVTDIIVHEGNFVVFFPQEAHQPGCMYQKPARVKKLVFKIRMV